MLYDILRIVSKVELLYKLRGSGVGRRRGLSQRIGYAGRTGAYKSLRRNLIQEGILSKEGIFIENAPNLWLARFSEHVEDPKSAVQIGRRIPYMVFLATTLNRDNTLRSTYHLAQQLRLNVVSVYAAVRALTKRGLVNQEKLLPADAKSGRQLRDWLRHYLDLSIEHANLTHDASKMFEAVPAYIDGLEALQRVRYVAGMPIGPAPMIIRTYEPYRSFWTRALSEVDDYRERGKNVSVDLAHPEPEIVWISRLPYSRRPKAD